VCICHFEKTPQGFALRYNPRNAAMSRLRRLEERDRLFFITTNLHKNVTNRSPLAGFLFCSPMAARHKRKKPQGFALRYNEG